jgi:hypothetical protein
MLNFKNCNIKFESDNILQNYGSVLGPQKNNSIERCNIRCYF